MPPLKDHILICGWNENGHQMVTDLHAASPDTSIALVCCPTDPGGPAIPEIPKLVHFSGNPADRETLRRAGLADARTAVILADSSRGGSAQTLDARTILTALTIRELHEEIHIIAELSNEDNFSLADTTAVDEWIFADHFSGGILTQAIESPPLIDLFTGLFETAGGCLLREIPVADELIGLSFSEALSQAPGLGLGALVGIDRHGDVSLPPQKDIELCDGDCLLVLQRMG